MRFCSIITSLFITATLTIYVINTDDITPHKLIPGKPVPVYDIPPSSRFTIERSGANAPKIVYYLSIPKIDHYPIAICCQGSSSKDDIRSVIHIHRDFLQEFIDLGTAVLTVDGVLMGR